MPEAGCDEAGRGCLAGPVFAAAVILPPGFKHPVLNDSKQLSKKQRDQLRMVIESDALAWAVAKSEPPEIDKLNILWASVLAMHRALDSLSILPAFIAVDGNKFRPYRNIPFKTLTKGDARFMNIAAASVLAKTYRDEYMIQLHAEFPEYGWIKNKGYPTGVHCNALRMHGPSPHHRKSFNLSGQLKLTF